MAGPGKGKNEKKKRGLVDSRWRETLKRPAAGITAPPSPSKSAPVEKKHRPAVRGKSGVVEVEKAKFTVGGERPYVPVRGPVLPASYESDRVVVMVRDPWMIFAYWEITPQKEAWAREEIIRAGSSPAQRILRVYDVSGKVVEGGDYLTYFDVVIDEFPGNWYIHVEPERSWRVEVGFLTRDGGFFCLARSNTVATPRSGVSDVIDPQWMRFGKEYEMLLTVRAGGGASPGMKKKERFRRRLEKWMFLPGISSPGISSFRNSEQKKRNGKRKV